MRGDSINQGELFSYVSQESRIPETHPIRKVRKIVDAALAEIEPAFDDMYSSVGRPSIPPEQLIRVMLLQIFFTIRSERQLVEWLDYDLMFRWFVGLGMDDRAWNHSVFSKNRDRLCQAVSMSCSFRPLRSRRMPSSSCPATIFQWMVLC